jgi:hypothetical protein
MLREKKRNPIVFVVSWRHVAAHSNCAGTYLEKNYSYPKDSVRDILPQIAFALNCLELVSV